MEYTNEEMKALFLDCIYCYIDYWDKQKMDDKLKNQYPNLSESKWKMEGVIFSVLALIDGTAGNFPGACLLIPFCSDEDIQEYKTSEEKYFPIPDSIIKEIEDYDIGGKLHNLFHERKIK